MAEPLLIHFRDEFMDRGEYLLLWIVTKALATHFEDSRVLPFLLFLMQRALGVSCNEDPSDRLGMLKSAGRFAHP